MSSWCCDPEYSQFYQDIYDLDVVSSLLETDTSSFFAAYARGDFDPTTIPPVPPELALILGETLSDESIQVEKRESPPLLEKSVENAYLTYFVDVKKPGLLETSSSSTSVAQDAARGALISDRIEVSGPSRLGDATMAMPVGSGTMMAAKAIMGVSGHLSSPSDSSSSGLTCATPPLFGFSRAAASRFAAAGQYWGKHLPKAD